MLIAFDAMIAMMIAAAGVEESSADHCQLHEGRHGTSTRWALCTRRVA